MTAHSLAIIVNAIGLIFLWTSIGALTNTISHSGINNPLAIFIDQKARLVTAASSASLSRHNHEKAIFVKEAVHLITICIVAVQFIWLGLCGTLAHTICHALISNPVALAIEHVPCNIVASISIISICHDDDELTFDVIVASNPMSIEIVAVKFIFTHTVFVFVTFFI